MDKFPKTYSSPKLNQEETNNLNKLIIISEIKPVLKIKISRKIKVQDQMTSKANSTKHIKKNLHWRLCRRNSSSQILPEDWWGGNTLKDILWSHHHPNIKTRQRHQQQRKLQANIFDECRCKNSTKYQQAEPTTHKKYFKSQPSWIHTSVTKMVQHIQIKIIYHIKKEMSKSTWSSQ